MVHPHIKVRLPQVVNFQIWQTWRPSYLSLIFHSFWCAEVFCVSRDGRRQTEIFWTRWTTTWLWQHAAAEADIYRNQYNSGYRLTRWDHWSSYPLPKAEIFVHEEDCLVLWQHCYTRVAPKRRLILQKLIVVQLLNKFLASYWTQRFITVFIRAHHGSITWARLIHPMPFHPVSIWSILILTA